MTRPATLLALLFLAGAARGARPEDGWFLDVALVQGAGTGRAEILLDSDHLRARQIGFDEEIVITREAITILDPARKVYATLSLDMLERMLGGMMAMIRGTTSSQIERLREAMKDLPEDQARAIEEEIARLERGAPSGRHRLEETEETEEVGGIPARRYRVMEDGREVGEAWFTDAIPAGMLREVYARLRGILPPEVTAESMFYGLLEDLPGFPVRLVGTNANGVTERVEVTEASRRETSAGDFAPGPGYTQQGLVDLGPEDGG